ncbi:hypothetical protein COOONC_08740 [Cooperia oncophora]
MGPTGAASSTMGRLQERRAVFKVGGKAASSSPTARHLC